jgi:hypothetical protein
MRLAWLNLRQRWALHSIGCGGALGAAVQGEQRVLDVALHRDPGVAGRIGVRVAQDSIGFGIDDDHEVRTMSGQGHAEPARIGGKRGRFAVAGQRMEDDDGFALQALRLVRRPQAAR